MRPIAVLSVIGLLCLATSIVAQEPAPADKTGLKVGEKAPAFKLNDQTGKPQTLDDLSKDVDYVALVFHRSANW